MVLEFLKEDSVSETEIKIQVGQNAKENWQLIDEANQDDLWFHVEGHPSSHVVISMPEKSKISKQTIKYAALLCKQHSKLNNNNKLTIIYTQIRHLTKGKEIGSVMTKRIQKLVI